MEELLISFTISLTSQREAVRGLRGTFSAGLCVLLKPEKCHQFLPGPMHAYPRHDPWKRLRTAKPWRARREIASDNWDKPAKGDNPYRKSYVLQGQQPSVGKIDMLKILENEWRADKNEDKLCELNG